MPGAEIAPFSAPHHHDKFKAMIRDGFSICVNGSPLLLDRSGALYLPGQRMLVFADLHF